MRNRLSVLGIDDLITLFIEHGEESAAYSNLTSPSTHTSSDDFSRTRTSGKRVKFDT
jgi:hypothetical protein